jgi:type II secretory pathway component GspD/PulD (secretin)
MGKVHRNVMAAAFALSFFFVAPASLHAAEFSNKKITYSVLDQSALSVVQNLSIMMGMPSVIDGEITGQIKNWNVAAPAKDVLARLEKDFGILYVYDGSKIIFFQKANLQVKTIDMKDSSEATVRRALIKYYPNYPKSIIASDKTSRTFLVRAPGKVVEIIEDIVTRQSKEKIKIIRYGQ